MLNDEWTKLWQQCRPRWQQARDKLRELTLAEVAGVHDPTGRTYLAAEERVRRAHPDLAELDDSYGGYSRRALPGGTRQPAGQIKPPAAVVISPTETERPNDPRPSPRRPLRRARLDQHGNAITWTDTGVIINDLEIIHEPTFDEASREIAARQRAHMLAGVEAHEALSMALAEVHPVYKRAYTA
jgi:hypothetical protein